MIRNILKSFFSSVKVTKEAQEKLLANKIKTQLQANYVEVIDTSNSGCGQMYRMTVESPLFEGKSKVDQHRMVNEAIKEEFKTIHGMTLKTIVGKKND